MILFLGCLHNLQEQNHVNAQGSLEVMGFEGVHSAKARREDSERKVAEEKSQENANLRSCRRLKSAWNSHCDIE